MKPIDIKNNLVRLVFLLLLQALVLKNPYFIIAINFNAFPLFFPMVYPLFFALLPLNFKKIPLLTLAFVVGFVVDVLYGTSGPHVIASLVSVFYLRNIYRLANINPLLLETNQMASIKNSGIVGFIIYISSFILLHHFLYFLISNFSFSLILNVLARTIFSSVLTILLILFLMLVFQKNRGKLKN